MGCSFFVSPYLFFSRNRAARHRGGRAYTLFRDGKRNSLLSRFPCSLRMHAIPEINSPCHGVLPSFPRYSSMPQAYRCYGISRFYEAIMRGSHRAYWSLNNLLRFGEREQRARVPANKIRDIRLLFTIFGPKARCSLFLCRVKS